MAKRFLDSCFPVCSAIASGPRPSVRTLGVPDARALAALSQLRPKTGIFYNSASRGFVIEAAPLVGADERTGEILTQFLSEGIPAPGCLQFHSG
jgi:conjugal transfer ATP-binding protein TraC